MELQNAINQIIFQTTISSAVSSFNVGIPSDTNNIFIVLENITATSSGDTLMLQTAKSEVFDTSGYQTGLQYSAYNSNAWSNNNQSSGLLLLYNSNANACATHYILDLNTANPAVQIGMLNITSGDPYSGIVGGLSPTTNASAIKFLMLSSQIATGSFTVYKLL